MRQDKPILITIIGNIGSGKSTLTKNLSHTLKAKTIKADELYLKNPFFPLAVKDRQRWSLASDLWFLHKRATMINHLVPKIKNKLIVIDSGLPMSWVYSHSRLKSGHYTKDEWRLYQTIYNQLTKTVPTTNILILLTASENFLLERIKKRGRKFEMKYFDKSYLQSLSESLNQYSKTMGNSSTRIVKININNIDLKKLKNLKQLLIKIGEIQ